MIVAARVEKLLDRHAYALRVDWTPTEDDPPSTWAANATVSANAMAARNDALIDLYAAARAAIRDGTAKGKKRWEEAEPAIVDALGKARILPLGR